MPQLLSTEKNYYIFAVYGYDDVDQRNVAYIGSTYSKRPYSRPRAHLRGKVISTDAYFGPDADCSSPRYKILEAIRCKKSMEYKHCLAWGRFFEKNGYHLVGDYIESDACKNLFPSTETVYNEVCAPYTLAEVLTRPDPVFPTPPPVKPPEAEDPLSQVNIRLRASVRQRFREYCSSFPGTQSEALDMLLRMQESSDDLQALLSQTCKTLQQMRETLDKQDQQLKHLENKLKDEKALISSHKRMELETLRSAVSILAEQQLPPPPDTAPLPIKKYAAFRKDDAHEYQYPKVPGAAIVIFEKLVQGKPMRSFMRGIWGKNTSALFILARTIDGEPMKLRWFPRKEYLGEAPNSRFATEGSIWLAGYLPTTGGDNTDLVVGIPLGKKHLIHPTPENPPPEIRHPALDDILAEIEARKS